MRTNVKTVKTVSQSVMQSPTQNTHAHTHTHTHTHSLPPFPLSLSLSLSVSLSHAHTCWHVSWCLAHEACFVGDPKEGAPNSWNTAPQTRLRHERHGKQSLMNHRPDHNKNVTESKVWWTTDPLLLETHRHFLHTKQTNHKQQPVSLDQD